MYLGIADKSFGVAISKAAEFPPYVVHLAECKMKSLSCNAGCIGEFEKNQIVVNFFFDKFLSYKQIHRGNTCSDKSHKQ